MKIIISSSQCLVICTKVTRTYFNFSSRNQFTKYFFQGITSDYFSCYWYFFFLQLNSVGHRLYWPLPNTLAWSVYFSKQQLAPKMNSCSFQIHQTSFVYLFFFQANFQLCSNVWRNWVWSRSTVWVCGYWGTAWCSWKCCYFRQGSLFASFSSYVLYTVLTR